MTEVVPEPTPNPNAVKFTLDRPTTGGRSETFRLGSDPAVSPLGARIYALEGVTNVFMTANFVSVTKEDDADWNELVPQVIDELQAHFAEGG
jgi:Scaffold protein Nfu/NifU N terminal